MRILRANTTTVVMLGPAINNLGVAQVAAGYTGVDVQISKKGSAMATATTLAPPVHTAIGYYQYIVDAADTDTPGELLIALEKKGTAFPIAESFYVVTEAVYDSLYGLSSVGYATALNVIDAIFTIPIPELPQATPPITPSLAEASMMQYMAIRNNNEADALGERRYKTAGGTVVFKATLLDDSITFKQGNLISGP